MAIHATATRGVLRNQLRIPTREADFLISTACAEGKANGVPNETSPLFGTLVTVHHAGTNAVGINTFTIEIH